MYPHCLRKRHRKGTNFNCIFRDVLLPSIVSAFKQLNLSVTAEGIETAEMAEEMKRIGFDFLQGYYYSQLIPADEFVRKYAK